MGDCQDWRIRGSLPLIERKEGEEAVGKRKEKVQRYIKCEALRAMKQQRTMTISNSSKQREGF